MRKWLAVGLLGLVVAWGPYLYAELVRSPVRGHGSSHRVLASNGPEEGAAGVAAPAGAGAAAPKPAAVADKAADKPGDPGVAPDKAAAPAAELAKPDDPAKAVSAAPPQPSAAAAAAKDQAAPANEATPPPPSLPTEQVPAFRKTFEAEPRDGFWAADEEPRLQKLFRTAGVAATDVSEVACRKTVCRVIWNAAASDNDETTKLYAALRDGYGTGLALDSKQLERDEHASLYVLRKGYQLEPAGAAP